MIEVIISTAHLKLNVMTIAAIKIILSPYFALHLAVDFFSVSVSPPI
jgi:hypothetical protein